MPENYKKYFFDGLSVRSRNNFNCILKILYMKIHFVNNKI